MSSVHPAARQGFTAEAAAYARGRPDYPAALITWLSGELALGPGKRAVDLGAGTGKFTRLLSQSGCEVVAIEPVAAMRARLSASLPAVRALDGTAAAMPLGDAFADAVVCAQAFHWFADQESLAEIHRVLKPGGRLGLVWNVRDESVDWVAEITRIITPYEGDAPRYHKGEWRAPLGESPFGKLEMTTFPHGHVGSAREVILDRFMSVSFLAALPAEQRAVVEARLVRLIESHPALRERASIDFPYRTEAYCCRRL